MNILNNFLNLIYPNVCGFCDKISKNHICKKCEIKLSKFFICNIDDYSFDREKYFSKHLYLFKYQGIIRDKLISYKFNEKGYMYKSFVKILLNNEKSRDFLKSYDIIMAVPIHNKRKLKRGYNQSELIAKDIAMEIKELEFSNRVLFKERDNKPQSSLKREDRISNVKDAYILKDFETIIDKKILLLDDIYTTGATLNECSRILKNVGTQKVDIITIAKD